MHDLFVIQLFPNPNASRSPSGSQYARLYLGLRCDRVDKQAKHLTSVRGSGSGSPCLVVTTRRHWVMVLCKLSCPKGNEPSNQMFRSAFDLFKCLYVLYQKSLAPEPAETL